MSSPEQEAYCLAIVDDSELQARVLQNMVEHSAHGSRFAVTRLSGASELEAFLAEGGHIDVLLIDIMLETGGPDGVELVQRHFPEGCGTQVVYVTGHIDYCTRVYRTAHVYFLVKPVDLKDLEDALGLALASLEKAADRPLSIRANGALVRIVPSEVEYIESDRRKIRIFQDGAANPTEAYLQLSAIAEELPESFIRCHKSFLVNLDYIAELRVDSVLMRSGAVVPVSQKRRKHVREAFLGHVRAKL